jgi:hypothetical protein
MLEIKAAHHDNATGDGGIIKRCAVLAEHGVARVGPILIRHIDNLIHVVYGMEVL